MNKVLFVSTVLVDCAPILFRLAVLVPVCHTYVSEDSVATGTYYICLCSTR